MSKLNTESYLLIGGVILVGVGVLIVQNQKDMKIENLDGILPTNGEYSKRTLDKIEGVVIHHSATTSGSAEAYARYHVKKGWHGIGYHIHVKKDGTVQFCQSLKNISYHTKGKNTSRVGICMTGHYDQQEPIQEQIDGVNHAIFMLEKALGRKMKIGFHNEFSSKSCPGHKMKLSDFRSKAFLSKIPNTLL